jgi:hypothetical protein
MVSTVENFFANLCDSGHVDTFSRSSATIRFDIREPGEREQAQHADKVERWYVTVTDGRVTATRQDRPADAIVHVSRPDFEAMATGRLNAQAAFLRGLLAVEGKVAALVMFQRCLPGPPGSTGRVAPISSKTVTAERRDT